ncbi:hypothetical protein [Euryhalocaulis caribicus]|uniref:hypothetical protein n=1 Tax=Euryhalocaulis caribicus TaxID=1161401 RepID=UPI00039F3ACE|nr:hypothetical protein [Euryhalocaulis caribicus]
MSRRPGFLRRSVQNEQRRRAQQRDADRAAGAAFRWAAIGVAILMVLALTVGFGGNMALTERLAAWAFLGQPVLFGLSWVDIAAILGVIAVAALFLYRDWRRTRD